MCNVEHYTAVRSNVLDLYTTQNVTHMKQGEDILTKLVLLTFVFLHLDVRLSDYKRACSLWCTGYFGWLVTRKVIYLQDLSKPACPHQEERLSLLSFVCFPHLSSELSPFSSFLLLERRYGQRQSF